MSHSRPNATGSVLGRARSGLSSSMSWGVIASESILTAERCHALSLSLPLSSTSGQTNKKTHMLPFLVTAEGSVHTSHFFHRNPEPSPASNHNQRQNSLPSSSVSGHFQTCLWACPALPGKPHHVRNKPFHTLDVCAVPPLWTSKPILVGGWVGGESPSHLCRVTTAEIRGQETGEDSGA